MLGRQIVARAEFWAVLMVLLVWDGTYDLTIITDAPYTVQGMDDLDRVLKECTKANYYKRMAAVKENFELAKHFKSPEMMLETFVLKDVGIFS